MRCTVREHCRGIEAFLQSCGNHGQLVGSHLPLRYILLSALQSLTNLAQNTQVGVGKLKNRLNYNPVGEGSLVQERHHAISAAMLKTLHQLEEVCFSYSNSSHAIEALWFEYFFLVPDGLLD